MCLFVDVNKHKSQRERNKRNHNISLSTMQKLYISFVIRFLRLFIKIPSTETLHLTCYFITKACVFCIFVIIRDEGQSLESLWRHPTHQSYIRLVRPFLTNLQAVRLCLQPVRMLHKISGNAAFVLWTTWPTSNSAHFKVGPFQSRPPTKWI